MTTNNVERRAGRRVLFASVVGTTVEWYDFFLYGSAAALVFNKLFFPTNTPLTGALLALTTYALGFVTRPIGGVVFGHFGDRIGRKRLLQASLLLMGASTLLIGLLPTFGQVGVLAPILLVLLRLIQGFAVGGEWGGAVLLVAEGSDPARRGFLAGFPQIGVAAGNLLAALALAVTSGLMSEHDFLAFGWRAPFILSAVLVLVGFWVRTAVAETSLFEAAQQARRLHAAPLVAVLRSAPRALLLGAGVRFAENVIFYMVTAFSLTYAVVVVKLERAVVLNAVALGGGVELCLIPTFSWLSDRVGRRPVTAAGAVGMILLAFPFFMMIGSRSPLLVDLAVVLGLACHAALYGPQAALLAELFPTQVRYTGMSIAAQATSILAGSLAPIVAISLLGFGMGAGPISIYIIVCCLITLAATAAVHETRGVDLQTIS